jgi:hypothetical protein
MGLVLLVFLSLWFRMRLAGAALWLGVVCLWLAAVASETRFHVRPEIVTAIWLSLMLWVLELKARQKRDWLFLLPLIQLAWVNTHGLTSSLGPCLIGLYLAEGWLENRRLDPALLKMGLLSAAACLVNPYFLKGALHPLAVWQMMRSGAFQNNIAEFQPTWSVRPSETFLFVAGLSLLVYKIFCFLLAFLLAATFRKRRPRELALCAVFFLLSTMAQRNVFLFLLVALPVAASCWKDLVPAGPALPGLVPGWAHAINRLFSKPALAWACAGALCLMGARVATSAYYISDRRAERFGLDLDRDLQPVQAVEFLKANKLDGRMINQMNCGAWLLWDWSSPHFIDGRSDVMGDRFFGEYLGAFKPGGLADLISKYQADLIFFSPKAALDWILDLKTMPDWRLIYMDGFILIYARQGYAPGLAALDIDQLPAREGISRPDPAEVRRLLQAPRPAGLGAWLDECFQPQEYPEGLLAMGIVSYYLDKEDASEAIFADGIRKTGGKYYEFFYDMGAMYARFGRADLARICMTRVLEEAPGDQAAQQVLNRLSAAGRN